MKQAFLLLFFLASTSVFGQIILFNNSENFGNTHFEAYRSLGGLRDGISFAGLNHVVDLSKKFSFAYGVSFTSFYSQGNAASFPIELRYYALPKENNLTSYFYCTYNSVLVTRSPVYRDYKNASLEIGNTIQTKISGKSSLGIRLGYQMPFSGLYDQR